MLLGIADVVVPWSTLLVSVVLYVVVPLLAGMATRRVLLGAHGDETRLAAFSNALKPFTIIGLLATVVLLFGFQGGRILEQPIVILLIAVPLLVQSYGIFFIAYGWAWAWRTPFAVAAPAALIGTSNFFELAVAVAISLFGLESGAALAFGFFGHAQDARDDLPRFLDPHAVADHDVVKRPVDRAEEGAPVGLALFVAQSRASLIETSIGEAVVAGHHPAMGRCAHGVPLC